MLHAKFQNHRTSFSGEDFLRFLPYVCMAAILVMRPGTLYKLPFPLAKEAPHRIWLWLAKRFQRKIVNGRRRTTDAGLWVSYKLTYEPSAQVSYQNGKERNIISSYISSNNILNVFTKAIT